jgi:3-hydroxyisobutyrate dehydrogenase-like beta-hydroxyacid dehydrogenase
MKIGMVGLGSMGCGMVRRLLATKVYQTLTTP